MPGRAKHISDTSIISSSSSGGGGGGGGGGSSSSGVDSGKREKKRKTGKKGREAKKGKGRKGAKLHGLGPVYTKEAWKEHEGWGDDGRLRLNLVRRSDSPFLLDTGYRPGLYATGLGSQAPTNSGVPTGGRRKSSSSSSSGSGGGGGSRQLGHSHGTRKHRRSKQQGSAAEQQQHHDKHSHESNESSESSQQQQRRRSALGKSAVFETVAPFTTSMLAEAVDGMLGTVGGSFSKESGYYVALDFGSEQQTFWLQIDTTTPVSWLSCDCTQCSTGFTTGPVRASAASSPCDCTQCSGASRHRVPSFPACLLPLQHRFPHSTQRHPSLNQPATNLCRQDQLLWCLKERPPPTSPLPQASPPFDPGASKTNLPLTCADKTCF
ncbi:unnamed protein product [Closterium sp. NIES-53]